MTLSEWLESRTPPVPGPFRPWMAPEVPDAAAGVPSLVREAEAALARALTPEGRPRRGAFDLLAADGFLTYACEAALDEEDARGALEEMVRRLVG